MATITALHAKPGDILVAPEHVYYGGVGDLTIKKGTRLLYGNNIHANGKYIRLELLDGLSKTILGIKSQEYFVKKNILERLIIESFQEDKTDPELPAWLQ